MFEFTTWHASFPDFFISLRHYTVIGKQLLLSNDRNRVRGAVLSLSQDGASTHLFESFREHSLKQDCAAGFALLNLPKGKSLGRSKPETNSYAQALATHCVGFLLYPSSAELPYAK